MKSFSAIQSQSATFSPRARRASMNATVWLLVLAGVGLANLCTPAATAQVYNWVSWSSGGGMSASATSPAFGTLSVSTTAGGTSVDTPFPLAFNAVPFSPVHAPSAAVGNVFTQSWTFTIDFALVTDSSRMFLGIGNFGHGTPTLPGYRLAAFDSNGVAISLGAFEQIGSYDHTWTESNIPFNDDVFLNTVNGDFVATRIAEQNDFNTDILLLALPTGIGRLEISTIALTSGDTINIVVAPRQTCSADFNNDGELDFFDYLDFVDAFSANLPGADFNNDSVIDFFDYLDFVDAFSIGC